MEIELLFNNFDAPETNSVSLSPPQTNWLVHKGLCINKYCSAVMLHEGTDRLTCVSVAFYSLFYIVLLIPDQLLGYNLSIIIFNANLSHYHKMHMHRRCYFR